MTPSTLRREFGGSPGEHRNDYYGPSPIPTPKSQGQTREEGPREVSLGLEMVL